MDGVNAVSLYIHGLAVDVTYRDMGIGKKLMKEFAKNLLKTGFIALHNGGYASDLLISLQTGEHNYGAHRFYERLGFKRVGTKKYPVHLDYVYLAKAADVVSLAGLQDAPHPFRAIDGVAAAGISLVVTAMAIGLINFFFPGIPTILVSLVMGGYGIWTIIKFALMGRATFNIVANDNLYLSAFRVLLFEVAFSDGTETAAFKEIQHNYPEIANWIKLHESYASHLVGMLVLMPKYS